MSTTTLEQLREEQSKLTQQIADAEREFVEGLPADAIRHKDFCEKYEVSDSLLAHWIASEESLTSYKVSHKNRYISEAAGLAVLRRRRGEAA